MLRPQFTLRTLLTAMLVVAAFLGGMALQKRLDRPTYERPGKMMPNTIYIETMVIPDGSRWTRGIDVGDQ
jgi:hypothetical protein